MAENYTIISVTKRTALTPAGHFKSIYEVIFVTPSGVRDTVEFEAAEYTPSNVASVLSGLAAMHEEIMGG